MNDKSLLTIQASLRKQINLRTKKNNVLECHADNINTVHAVNAPKKKKVGFFVVVAACEKS